MKVAITHAGAASNVKGRVVMLHATVSKNAVQNGALLPRELANQAIQMARKQSAVLKSVHLLVHDWMLHDNTFTFFCDVANIEH